MTTITPSNALSSDVAAAVIKNMGKKRIMLTLKQHVRASNISRTILLGFLKDKAQYGSTITENMRQVNRNQIAATAIVSGSVEEITRLGSINMKENINEKSDTILIATAIVPLSTICLKTSS